MACARAGAQGIRDALDILLEKGRIGPEQDLQTVVLTGDGAAYGMGLAATSGAIEQGLDFVYVRYDNEGYGNTGQQYSAATPHGARTATSRGPGGFSGYKKDLFGIWAAHRPAYVATVVGAEPVDSARKIEKVRGPKRPRMIIALSPCPTGWDHDPRESGAIGELAVKTEVWPLKECLGGQVLHTKVPHTRLPVEAYLERRGRFGHLFRPQRSCRRSRPGSMRTGQGSNPPETGADCPDGLCRYVAQAEGMTPLCVPVIALALDQWPGSAQPLGGPNR